MSRPRSHLREDNRGATVGQGQQARGRVEGGGAEGMGGERSGIQANGDQRISQATSTYGCSRCKKSDRTP